MSREPDLKLDDLDADIVEMAGEKLKVVNMQLINIAKARDKIASLLNRHLARSAAAKGIIIEEYDFDIATKSFVQKDKTAETPVLEV